MTGKPATRAGGAIIAIAIIAGVFGGIVAGEPSAGFLAGAALGVLVAVALWLRDKRHP